ncbi:MAG TPA: hypothetical protein VMV72_17360 [Verrucomicrobiae bacterium]|nr:hypothetical protein [Verrucomicrobiae bacterium]
MKGTKAKCSVWLGLVLTLLVVPNARAVLFVATDDPSYNTNAPTGSLANSGWQYEGQWGLYLGTPIAPTFFIAAQHIGGSAGQPFVLNGFTYTTVTNFDDPGTDLRIWQVAQTFPYYAPLYTGSDEVGQPCVAVGRGTQRGSLVSVNGPTNGWMWSTSDHVQRWGQNTVAGVYTNGGDDLLLYANFELNGMTNECDLSPGDSSGGLFIQNGSTWQLAGVHYSVSGPFSFDGSSADEFNAAVVDQRGLYFEDCDGGCWTLVPTNYPVAVPGAFYSTRVSSRISWISSVINYNLGNDLGILGIKIVGSDVQISLLTGSNRYYRVDYTTNLVNATWMTLTNNIPGTTGPVTVVDSGVATNQPSRFYRATVLP